MATKSELQTFFDTRLAPHLAVFLSESIDAQEIVQYWVANHRNIIDADPTAVTNWPKDTDIVTIGGHQVTGEQLTQAMLLLEARESIVLESDHTFVQGLLV